MNVTVCGPLCQHPGCWKVHRMKKDTLAGLHQVGNNKDLHQMDKSASYDDDEDGTMLFVLSHYACINQFRAPNFKGVEHFTSIQ